MFKTTAKKVTVKNTHRMITVGKQVSTPKGRGKRGSNKSTAFKNPPVARVGKSQKKLW
jgi:hypothetical protein